MIAVLLPGYTTARDAFDALGRQMHGGDWTGTERDAPFYSCPPGVELARGGDAPGSGRFGGRAATVAPPPPDVFSEQYRRDYEASMVARARWSGVMREALEQLQQGKIQGCAVDRRSGHHDTVPRDVWLKGNAAEMLKGGWVEYYRWSRRRELLISEIKPLRRGGAPEKARAEIAHRPPDRREAAIAALNELYPTGDFAGGKMVSLLAEVNDLLRSKGKPVVSIDTLRRAKQKILNDAKG